MYNANIFLFTYSAGGWGGLLANSLPAYILFLKDFLVAMTVDRLFVHVYGNEAKCKVLNLSQFYLMFTAVSTIKIERLEKFVNACETVDVTCCWKLGIHVPSLYASMRVLSKESERCYYIVDCFTLSGVIKIGLAESLVFT